jgi:hypothetical protein
MSKEEIALQLTLKSIDRIGFVAHSSTLKKDNLDLSNQVVDFYNNIYNKLDLGKTTVV